MPIERIVIIGGGPAGFATARSYREYGGTAEVTLVGDEPRLPYERPPLSKEFLRGTREAAGLTIERQEWFDDHEVELCLGVSATAVDPRWGTVTVADGRELRADAIVFATGSAPIRLSVPGAEHPEVQTFRTLEDSELLARRTTPRQRVLVIGSGFMGCEIAGSLAMRGIAATLIAQEPLPHHERLGPQAAEQIAGWMGDLDVELIGDAPVVAIHDGREVELEDGRRIAGGCVVLAAGARPRGDLAAGAGLAMHDGALVVDAAMRASNGSSVALAVGDVAYAYNTTARRHLRVEHWGDALAHGAIAGHTLATGDGQWDGVPGFWSTIGERTLKYAAWGDGHDSCRLVEHADGAFTIWYERDGTTVGVLTHERDDDYQQGRERIAKGEPPP